MAKYPPKKLSLRDYYLYAVSTVGASLLVWGIWSIPTYNPILIFILLFTLAVAAQITSTLLIGGNVIVEVSSAISLATAALFGPKAAVIVSAAALITLTVFSLLAHWTGWKGAFERIGFNVGISTIAVYLAGLVFLSVPRILGIQSWLTVILSWLLAAIVNDQVNLWLLIVLLHLQNKTKPLVIWKEHRWAIPINVLVMTIGGGILAVAVQQFNYLGIAIFFLPIVLSAYSFRLYVNQTKKQMEQLEDLVAERTRNLEEANKELAELSKEKDQFLAVLTHDMRTPLTSIKGYASILRDREMSREQQVHVAKVVLKSQETLLEIVNNILEIEKLQSGVPILLEVSEFDVALLAQTIAEALEPQAVEKKITLHYDKVPSPIVINADEQKIERVLTNLISNAIKYTPEGGEVFVDTAVDGRYALITIRDTGYGIPEDELPFIFERYTRVKKHQTVAIGTGLGLAIVKSLVEAHNGEITVKSKEDEGSTFTVKIPIH